MTDPITSASGAKPDANQQRDIATAVPARPARGGRASERLAREAAARRALFAACLAGFVAFFALIAGSARPAPAAIPATAASPGDAPASSRVIAEVPISGLNGAGETTQTIVRILAPGPQPVTAHVRTMAS